MTDRLKNVNKLAEQKELKRIVTKDNQQDHSSIHPKSESPGSPDSANYFNFPQNYSLRIQKLPTLLY